MTVHATKALARRALLDDGFWPSSATPGVPAPWVNKLDPTDRRAIYGNDVVGWQIVPYPNLQWLDD